MPCLRIGGSYTPNYCLYYSYKERPCGDVDGHGHVASVHQSQYLVLIAVPAAEAVHIAPHPLIVGVEDVRPIFVHQNSGLSVNIVVTVTSNVISLVYDQHCMVQVVGNTFSEHCSRKPTADN